ncbi:hypothetical protein JMUB3935_1609 [Leptotrichia trevisanii]|uniref:Uncharacterized protein n=1 Tax=Leptotrichia trevisanii TaxID=109328 RepID=A0A510KLN8_9FUSO|nr:hypothetical protein [Leptotrichia trevisanii]BBM45416.1 hypothetical protein JMUB3870_1535 [Leptotrichia trevisanii]BBM52630.1 hypothetical protein JMUB3935_1609 [Leptotrichia trevisanii]
MEKLRRIIMGMLLLSFTTVVKANYYIAENIGTNNGGDATTVEEERTPAVPPTTEADDNTRKVLEQGSEKSKPKEEKKTVDTGTMPATQTEDISTEAKYNSYANYENATLAKKSSSATFRMAQLYFRDGLYEKAVNLALKDEAPDIPVMYVIAIGSRLMGDNEKSIDYYTRILSQDENQAEAKLGIGIAYKSKGDFSKALGYLRDYNSKYSNDEVKKEIAVLNEILAGSR